MPKTKNKKTTKKNKSTQKLDSLLKRQIFLEQQAEFYKKHSNAKTLIIIFILLVLVWMLLYLNSFGNAWLGELRLLFMENGLAQAGR